MLTGLGPPPVIVYPSRFLSVTCGGQSEPTSERLKQPASHPANFKYVGTGWVDFGDWDEAMVYPQLSSCAGGSDGQSWASGQAFVGLAGPWTLHFILRLVLIGSRFIFRRSMGRLEKV